jgi:pimeloyl-ACP methyl ester carboxylesterase
MRVVLESGRGIAVYCLAAPASSDVIAGERIVVFCHSAPGAGAFDPGPEDTHERGVTLLSVDRPGYGASDPVDEGRWATVASAADDLAAVLDRLGVARVGVVGWSAGGRVALALAARHPDLVDRVAVVATPAPDAEVPWVSPAQRAALERLRAEDPGRVHAALADQLGSLVPQDTSSPEAMWLLGAGQADQDSLRGDGAAVRLGEMLRAAFAQGARGLAADIAGFCLHPWGFEPAAVLARTLLVYGSHDPVAGPGHGRWWEARLPYAQLEVAPGAGHLLIVSAWSRILSHVAPGRSHLRPVDGARNGDADVGVEEFSAA